MTRQLRIATGAALFVGVTWLVGTTCVADPDQGGANNASQQQLSEFLRRSRATRTAGDHQALAFEILPAIDEAMRTNNFPIALRLASLAAESARKARNNHALTLANSRRERAATAVQEFKEVSDAFETLRRRPDDRQANLEAGRFTCFVKGDWEAGLPMFSRGSDPRLKRLAEWELQPMQNAQQLAKGWLEAAAAESPASATPLYTRAYHWARQVSDDAPGEEEQPTARILDQLPMRYLTDLEQTEINPGPWPIGRRGQTGAPNGSMIEVNGIPFPDGIGMHPPDSGFASAKYRLNGRFETFESGVAISDHQSEVSGAVVFMVIGDGKVLWRSPPISNWGDAQFCRVGVKDVQTLELRTQVRGGGFGAHAAWLDPFVSR